MPISTSTAAPGQAATPASWRGADPPGGHGHHRRDRGDDVRVQPGNVTQLCLHLGITAWIAWLVGPAVDLSVVGPAAGMRFLSLHGYTDAQLLGLQRMLRFCGLLTLALNTAEAFGHRQFGTALVDAVGPALLIVWSEKGPWMLRQIHAVSSLSESPQPAGPLPRQAAPPPTRAAALPTGLLARTRELDAEHRAETGRPISRDALRARLRIGRDRAGDLVAAVRAEAAARAAPSAGPSGLTGRWRSWPGSVARQSAEAIVFVVNGRLHTQMVIQMTRSAGREP